MKRTELTVTACACLALLGCGGGGPSGGAQDATPRPAAEGRAEKDVVQSGNAHYDNVIEMLRGKAPGVQIIETTPGQMEVRIRGLNQSFQGGGQEPLVIVDGAASGRPAGQALLALNPDDVQRIEVLKDVGSTSVYGTRGANGVILVTTRRRQGPRP